MKLAKTLLTALLSISLLLTNIGMGSATTEPQPAYTSYYQTDEFMYFGWIEQET